MSSSSVLSCGWEEVSISDWDVETLISDSSVDSDFNDKVNTVGLNSLAVKQEEEFVENLGIFEMADKSMDNTRSFSTSESEDSSSEPLAALSGNLSSLNETVNSNMMPSSNKNVVNKISVNESYECEGNFLNPIAEHLPSKEADRSTPKVSTDIREKTIEFLRENNEVLNSKDYIPVKLKEELSFENISDEEMWMRQNNEVLNSKDYISVKLKEQLSIENITDEEIWMVQCPVDLDPKKLVDKEFDFTGISEFAVETDKVYTATACSGRWKTLSCLLPSSERKQLEAVVVNAAGQIIITEKVTSSQLNSAVPARNKIEFPENLKVRHPLFGADYEKELNIRRQRLLVSSLKKKKKKKKERKEMPNDISYGTISEDQADDCTPSLLEDMEPQMDIAIMSKKTKKRKHSESFITNSDHSENDTGKLETKHLKKKRKKSLLSNSVDESMEIDSHINQEYSKKKKKKKKYDVE